MLCHNSKVYFAGAVLIFEPDRTAPCVNVLSKRTRDDVTAVGCAWVDAPASRTAARIERGKSTRSCERRTEQHSQAPRRYQWVCRRHYCSKLLTSSRSSVPRVPARSFDTDLASSRLVEDYDSA